MTSSTQLEPTPPKKFGGFRPVNDYCRDCNKKVAKGARQELVFDENAACRRLCSDCLKKLGGR